MKKILVFAIILFAINSGKVLGQTITFVNSTSYSFTAQISAHDGTYTGCNGLGGTVITIGTGTSPAYTIYDFNTSGCAWPGSWSGWGAGTGCATPGGGVGWDGISMVANGCSGLNFGYQICPGTPPTLPLTSTDCSHVSVFFDWINVGGNITVKIY